MSYKIKKIIKKNDPWSGKWGLFNKSGSNVAAYSKKKDAISASKRKK